MVVHVYLINLSFFIDIHLSIKDPEIQIAQNVICVISVHLAKMILGNKQSILYNYCWIFFLGQYDD